MSYCRANRTAPEGRPLVESSAPLHSHGLEGQNDEVFQQPRSGPIENVARVGIDLGKQVFHVTAVDGEGAVVERRRLRRAGLRGYLSGLPRGCGVAMESCGGAHHWARLALSAGLRPLLLSRSW